MREDRVTSTPEDAATYERLRGGSYGPADDAPALADLEDVRTIGARGEQGPLTHALVASDLQYEALDLLPLWADEQYYGHPLATRRVPANVRYTTAGQAHGVVRLDGLAADHAFVAYLEASPAWDVLVRENVVYARPTTTTKENP